MARPFSYPEVAALAIGESCIVQATASTAKRKCALYGARNRKRFTVTGGPDTLDGRPTAAVRREEVTDAELPSAA